MYGLQVKFTDSDGLRFIIHNSSIDPVYYGDLKPNGINISPGFNNDLALNRIFTYKLGELYNNCLKHAKSIDSFDSDLYRFMIKSTNYSYRQSDCFDYCIGKEINKYMNISNRIDHWATVLHENSNDINKTIELIKVYKRLFTHLWA